EVALPIKVGNNVWIGTGTIILAGVEIGDGSIVGAGSVVTKSIPSNVIAYGNPCKVIRKLTEEDKKRYPSVSLQA
ncbi:MAG: sugar O-acetyltransferase, partial [Spirochaetales bacterium]|nr:sugar O-acetyltransferase [Spirochaetales bacterium]